MQMLINRIVNHSELLPDPDHDNNITDEKRGSLTHNAEIVSPLAHPPMSLDIFTETFLAVTE